MLLYKKLRKNKYIKFGISKLKNVRNKFVYFLSNYFDRYESNLYFSFAVLRKAFDSFDRDKSGSIPTDMVADILRLMGQPFNKKILDELIDEVDADSKYNKYRIV